MFIAAFFACVATTLPDGRADVLILFFNGVLDRFIFGDRVADMVLLGSWKMCLPLPGSFFLAGLRSRLRADPGALKCRGVPVGCWPSSVTSALSRS